MVTQYRYELVDSCAQVPASWKWRSGRSYRHIYVRRTTYADGVYVVGSRYTLCDHQRQYDGSTSRCEADHARAACREYIALAERRQVMRELARMAGLVCGGSDAILDGEAVAAGVTGRLLTRYNYAWKKTGVALRMPRDLRARFGAWEHGKTEATCRAEIATKRAVVSAEMEHERVAAENAERARHRERLGRHVRLVAGLRVGFTHARAAGMCEAGIRAFCVQNGLDLTEGATVEQLRALPDTRWVAAAQVALRAVLAARSIA